MRIEQAERAATGNSESSSLNLNSITNEKGGKLDNLRETPNAAAANALPDIALTDKINGGGKPNYIFDQDRLSHMPGGKKDELDGGKKPILDGGKKDDIDGGKPTDIDGGKIQGHVGGKKDDFDGGKPTDIDRGNKPRLDGGKDEFEGGKRGKNDPDEPDCIKPVPEDKERFWKKEKAAEIIRLKKEKAADLGESKYSLPQGESE